MGNGISSLEDMKSYRLHRKKKVMKLLGISVTTFNKIINTNQLQYVRVGNAIRVPEFAIAEYLRKHVTTRSDDEVRRTKSFYNTRASLLKRINLLKKRLESNPNSMTAKRYLEDAEIRLRNLQSSIPADNHEFKETDVAPPEIIL